MRNYLIVILIAVVALVGLLLYIGDDARLLISSTAETGPLALSPIEMTWQFAILLSTALTLAIIGLWSVFLWLWRLPRRVKSGVGLRRRNKALDAMEDALIAGSEGDIDRARKKSETVRNLVGNTDLGRIISAQAAEACGDKDEAISHYTAMLDSDRTRVSGQRGLAQTQLATGDIPGAIDQASRAYATHKNARWAFDVLFKAQVADHQWDAALETLELGAKRGHIDADNARRRRAVLLTAQADRAFDDHKFTRALDRATQAVKISSDFGPAVALAAAILTRDGGQKKATKLIENAWTTTPHPALSLAFLDLYPDEAAKARASRVASLVSKNPTHRESVLLSVESALRNDNAVEAWSKLSPLLEREAQPSARLCLLAAQVEARLDNAQDAHIWLSRAATAPHEGDWTDLDPDGAAFDYTPNDWRRLIFSYGDTGELIHPRAERSEALRLPGLQTLMAAQTAKSSPLDPNEDTEALAQRLDSLLDDN